MVNIKLSILVFISICMANFSHAAGNGWVSSGGDDIPFSVGSSWFNTQNTKEISVCIETAENYNASKGVLQGYIEKAFKTWENYYLSKLKYYRITSNQFHPTFRYKIEGSCNNKTQISFLFNIENESVLKNKIRYKNPYAFSAFNDDTKTGIIWFGDILKMDDSVSKSSLEIMITHELGHVFGVPHVNGTIMNENIVKDLRWENVSTNIDQQRMLLFTTIMNFNLVGKLRAPIKFIPNYDLKLENERLFERFTGRKPQGTFGARLVNLGRFMTPALKLSFFDEVGEVLLAIDNSKTVEITKEEASIFKVNSVLENANIETLSGLETQKWYGVSSIKDASNNEYQIIINLNPFRVYIENKGETTLLFYLE